MLFSLVDNINLTFISIFLKNRKSGKKKRGCYGDISIKVWVQIPVIHQLIGAFVLFAFFIVDVFVFVLVIVRNKKGFMVKH
jgi:ABC-type uncharacterized transport system permease subunit